MVKMNKILTDIMGTTSPSSYVKTLMADFRENGASYITRATPEAIKILDQIKEETGLKTGEEIVEYVDTQLRKKNLQPHYLALTGLVNIDSYTNGNLEGKFFDDVPRAFANWKKNEKGLYVFSNGSEESQKAMFRTHSEDLSLYVDRFFDTAAVGSKYEADSYKRISDIVHDGPENILFLSDLQQELDAADEAGCKVNLVVRPGNKSQENKYKAISSFQEVENS
jgi:enolase-phosphatase E1